MIAPRRWRSCEAARRSWSFPELLMLLVLTEREHGSAEMWDIFKSMRPLSESPRTGGRMGVSGTARELVATTRLSEACRLCLSPPGPRWHSGNSVSACSCSLVSRPPPHLSCSQHTAITTDLTDGAQEQLLLHKVKDSQGEHARVCGGGGTSPDTLSRV